MKKITTNYNDYKFFEEKIDFIENTEIENNLINIYEEKEYQKILGFGGAFTESGGYVLSTLSNENREEIIEKYFGENGLKYNFCRTHISSCDFSLGNYSYIDDNDETLETFNINRDKEYLIPFINSAKSISKKEIKLLASPWSPPPFMKTNGEKNGGGKLKKEYRSLWAKYIVKYIKAYEEIGIIISYVSIQNEPKAAQPWDSCVYTTEEELDFAKNYLRTELDSNNYKNIKIIAWDHNKERLYEKAQSFFNDEKGNSAIDGLGFHWYSGDHFETLKMTREDFPSKELFFTEGCVEYSRFAGKGDIFNAEMYAHDIIGNFNNGMNTYIDWNMVLDETGGPNHVNNFCAAPIMCNTKNNSYEIRLPYYYIGHLSKYVERNAVRIGFSKFTDKLDVTAFKNPNGEIVVIILNRTDNDIEFTLRKNNEIVNTNIEKHSIISLIY